MSPIRRNLDLSPSCHLLAGRAERAGYDIRAGNKTIRNASVIDHNLLEDSGRRALLRDPAKGDFRPKADSPSRDAGVPHAVYALFQSRYGLSIKVDRAGSPRPQGGGWDQGAYEQ
ncbi:MAG: hypothetical protein IH991_15175 [Planctomycetes bacterium]|nr:hypothetical protein [Planctomycetota bacterium]